MEPLVSIIIPEFEDDTYLIRCLNSIKRQTYQNYEVIIANNINSSKKMWAAVKKACGELLFFCRVTSVLAPNTIQILVENTESDMEHCFMAICLKETQKGYSNVCGMSQSLYYKLLDKKRFIECMESKEKDFEGQNLIVMAHYLQRSAGLTIERSAFIYENELAGAFDDSGKIDSVEQIDEFGNLLSKQELEKQETKAVYHLLLEMLCDIGKQVYVVSVIAVNYKSDLEWNYQLAKIYIKKAYEEAKTDNDEKLYDEIKKYILIWQDKPEFLKLLLDILNIDVKEKELFFKYSLEEFIYFGRRRGTKYRIKKNPKWSFENRKCNGRNFGDRTRKSEYKQNERK